MDWFRRHHGAPLNPRWRLIARRSGQPVAFVIAVWDLMEDNASRATPRGTLVGWDDEAAAIALDMEPEAVQAIRKAMQGKALNVDVVMDWEITQPKREREDDSTERVKRYRDRVRQGGGTVGGYLRHHAALMERDGGRCVYCAATSNLCIDHLTPVQQGGTDDIGNLAIACKACNSGKSGRTPEEAGYVIACTAAASAYKEWLGLSRHVTPPVTPKRRKSRLSRPDREIEEKREKEEQQLPPPEGAVAAQGDLELARADKLYGWLEDRRKAKGLSVLDGAERGKALGVAKWICDNHSPERIRDACRGIGKIWPYAPPPVGRSEMYTMADLKERFTDAADAAANPPQVNTNGNGRNGNGKGWRSGDDWRRRGEGESARNDPIFADDDE